MDTFMGRYRNVSILAAAVFLQVVGLAVQVKSKPVAGKDDKNAHTLIRVWTVAALAQLRLSARRAPGKPRT
jgi:hypothetical protein